MTRKQIDISRERRLWLGQIIIPACTLVVTVLANQDLRNAIVNKAGSVKTFIKNKFGKKNES